jgi:hypothetical protein
MVDVVAQSFASGGGSGISGPWLLVAITGTSPSRGNTAVPAAADVALRRARLATFHGQADHKRNEGLRRIGRISQLMARSASCEWHSVRVQPSTTFRASALPMRDAFRLSSR